MAYHESVQLGQELSKRINDDPTSKSKADDDSSDDENEFQTETGKRQKTSGRAAKEMLSVLEGAEDEPEATGKYKKLFEMDFMKRASADKKERAREEAQNILREIENMEGDSDEEADKVGDIGKKSEKDIAALKAAREQMKSQLGQSSSGMSLKGTTKKISVSGPISVQSETSSKARKGAESDTVRWIQETEEVVSAAVPVDTMTDNPWLSAPVSGKKRDSTGQKVNHIKSSVEVASVVVVGQKRVAQGSVSSSGNTEKKSRIGGATSVAAAVAVSGHLPSTTVTATTTTTTAVTVPVVAAKAVASKERKPLLMQKSQVRYHS